MQTFNTGFNSYIKATFTIYSHGCIQINIGQQVHRQFQQNQVHTHSQLVAGCGHTPALKKDLTFGAFRSVDFFSPFTTL